MIRTDLDRQYREALAALRKQEWVWALLISLIFYFACSLQWTMTPEIVRGRVYPAVSSIWADYWKSAIMMGLLALPPLCSALLYLVALARSALARRRMLAAAPGSITSEDERKRYYLRQMESYQGKARNKPHLHLFFGLLCGIEIIVMVSISAAYRAPDLFRRASADLELFAQGRYEVYEGMLHSTDKPTDYTGSFRAIPDKNLYYFTGGNLPSFRCPANNYDGTKLMQLSYTVHYLPNTRTIISLRDAQGQERLGAAQWDGGEPDGDTWLYGDLRIRRCTEVYGYDRLTEPGRKMFDLIYGQYLSPNVQSGEDPTHSFDLFEPVTAEEYQQVQSLYRANTFYDCYPTFRYTTNGGTPIKTIYAGGKSYAGNYSRNVYNQRFRQKAQQIVSEMPPGLTDAEKCRYLCEYLVRRVRFAGTDGAQMGANAVTQGSITVLLPTEASDTGYGALVEGYADSNGYAQAFDLMARLAGLRTLPVLGETPDGEHVWNMVELDGEWYHVDTAWADMGSEINGAYLLCDDRQIAADHRALSYGGCSFVDLPKATGTAHNWLRNQALAFDTAEDALAAALKNPPGKHGTMPLLLPDAAGLARLEKLMAGDAAKGLRLWESGGFSAPVYGYLRQPDFSPAPAPDFLPLRAAIPYPGLQAFKGDDVSRLPLLGDKTAQHLTLALHDLLAGVQLPSRGFDRTQPDPEFIALAAIGHTLPVAWDPAGETEGTAYEPSLAPIAQNVIPQAASGVLQEHLAQSIRLIFGDGVPMDFDDIPEQNYVDDPHTEWKYDPGCGVFIHIPPGRLNRSYYDLIVLDYQETETGWLLTAAEMQYHFYHDSGGPNGYIGYDVGIPNQLAAPDDPAVAAYCQDTAPRRQIELKKREDGGLSLVYIGPIK